MYYINNNYFSAIQLNVYPQIMKIFSFLNFHKIINKNIKFLYQLVIHLKYREISEILIQMLY